MLNGIIVKQFVDGDVQDLSQSVQLNIGNRARVVLQCPFTWDFVERSGQDRNLVCVITGAERYPVSEVRMREEKLKVYLKEVSVTAPVFSVTAEVLTGEWMPFTGI